MTMRSNLRVSIDYLSMVVDNLSALDFITYVLQIPPKFFQVRNGRVQHMPYTKLYHCGKVQVFGDVPPSENNPKGVGCYLSLTGGGCREFFDIFCNELWEENLAKRNYGMFFTSCNLRQRFDYRGYEYLSYHVTRLDIAIDDFNEKPFFTPQQLYKKCLKGEFVSASRTFGGSEKGTAEDGLGKTLYIGDGSSNLSYRFYDKDVQQFQRYGTALEELGSWKRCELQLRDETANGFAQLMAKEPDIWASRFLTS